MQKLLSPFLILAFFIAAPTQTEAKALIKTHNLESLRVDVNGGYAMISINTRLSLDTIVGEPKVVCSGTWKFQYAIIDASQYDSSNLPSKVINSLNLHNVDILYDIDPSIGGVWYGSVMCDPGVFYKSGSSRTSFTTPASPGWDKFIQHGSAGFRIHPYFTESEAKASIKELKKHGSISSRANGDDVVNASLDISSIHRYIEKQKREEQEKIKKEKKGSDELEDIFDEVEGTGGSSSESGFDEMFDDTENTNIDASNLSSDLDQIDRADIAQHKQKQRYKKLAPLRAKRDRNLGYCENGKPTNGPFHCSMSFNEGPSGLHLTVIYEDQSDAAKQRRKRKAEQAKRRREEEARERAIYNERVTRVCKDEKQEWSRLKTTYSKRLQAWRDSREQCISSAHKNYRADIHRLDEEEKKVDKDLEELTFE